MPQNGWAMSGIHKIQNSRLEIERAVENGDVMSFAELAAQGRLYLAENQLGAVAR